MKEMKNPLLFGGRIFHCGLVFIGNTLVTDFVRMADLVGFVGGGGFLSRIRKHKIEV